jgi:hypothetical protein
LIPAEHPDRHAALSARWLALAIVSAALLQGCSDIADVLEENGDFRGATFMRYYEATGNADLAIERANAP